MTSGFRFSQHWESDIRSRLRRVSLEGGFYLFASEHPTLTSAAICCAWVVDFVANEAAKVVGRVRNPPLPFWESLLPLSFAVSNYFPGFPWDNDESKMSPRTIPDAFISGLGFATKQIVRHSACRKLGSLAHVRSSD